MRETKRVPEASLRRRASDTYINVFHPSSPFLTFVFPEGKIMKTKYCKARIENSAKEGWGNAGVLGSSGRAPSFEGYDQSLFASLVEEAPFSACPTSLRSLFAVVL